MYAVVKKITKNKNKRISRVALRQKSNISTIKTIILQGHLIRKNINGSLMVNSIHSIQ